MSSIVSDEKIYEQASLRRRMVIVVLIVLFLLGAIVAYNMIKAHFIAEYRKPAAARRRAGLDARRARRARSIAAGTRSHRC